MDNGSGGDGDAGIQDMGLCTSSPVSCDDRSQAQCNSGCTFEPTCHSPSLERCASYRDPDMCDADTACYWQLDACKPEAGGACGINESQTACANDPVDTCLWGPACTGFATYCFELDTAAACTANLGCEWKPR